MTHDFEAFRRVDVADVWKKELRAATLRRTPQGVEFAYDHEYLEAGGRAVASTLPVSRSTVITPAGAVPPYLAGLLPEGRRLAVLRAAVKTSADDDLSLLLAVGGDAVGDVRVLPSGHEPSDVAPRVSLAKWSDTSFAEIFAAETGAEPDRVAMPGAQPKASARMISFPVRKGTGRFVLKLDPPEFRHLCRNEWMMLRSARASGLPTVNAELVTDRDGREALAVQRFDRTAEGALLAVEDGCQALGRYPADKYNVTTEAVLAALAEMSDAPVVAARTFLQWTVFAYVSGNGDLHAKNLAVAERTDATVQPSPAFDLPASYPYGDATMALTLGGKSRDDIGRQDMIAMAQGLGVAQRAAGRVIDRVVEAAEIWVGWLDEVGLPARTTHKWRRLVKFRQQRLAD